jgi:integrase/recombinase XerD
MNDIRWTLYPRTAAYDHAREWLEIQQKLLRSPKTIDAYARSINDFLAVCQRLGIQVESVTKGDIATYVEDMADRPRSDGNAVHPAAGLANRTIQLRLTALRLFYDFLLETGERDVNPVGRGRYTRSTGFYGMRERGLVPRFEKQPWIPTDEQWGTFLEVMLQEESLRNQLMTFMAYDGALRRSELLSLKLSDIDFPHQAVRIRPETVKYRSGRIIFYGDATSDLLVHYVRQRQQLLTAHPGARGGALFIAESRRNRGQALSYEMWNKIVKRLAERAGLPIFTTHTFRHLRLTDLARCKLDLHEIAMYAGHRNPKTTHQYIQLSSTELGERVRLATKHIDERNKRLLERMRCEHDKPKS